MWYHAVMTGRQSSIGGYTQWTILAWRSSAPHAGVFSKTRLLILVLLVFCAFSLQALQMTNCFERIDAGNGMYHLRCVHPAFSKIDFCVELQDSGWSVVEHSDVDGVKIYKARAGISVRAYAQSHGGWSFRSSSAAEVEIPICFAWHVGADWYYGWVYAEKKDSEVVIRESCVETIANRTLCYRSLEIRDGSVVKRSSVSGVEWTYRMFDTFISLGGGTQNQTAVSTRFSGDLTLPTTQFDVGPVTEIADYAFAGCRGITSVVIPDTVTHIGAYAFADCSGLTAVTLPSSVTNVGVHAFIGCTRLASLAFPAGLASLGELSSVETLIVQVPGGPSVDSGWSKRYGKFRTLFGSNFATALMAPTGKRDGAGRELLVWHDYVAGTDPTDRDDAFVAKITIVGGVPQITWYPELAPNEAAMRRYVTYGKDGLSDPWSVVDGDAANYRFFKVDVKMR